jgi:ribonuclease T2
MSRLRVAALLLLAAPVAAHAQTYSCSVPGSIPRPHPDLATEREPQRVLPIGGYTLAINWAPQYCHGNARKPAASFQCQSGNRFGFTLHGLWPDGVGKEWPQYCTSTDLLPEPVIKSAICATPSAQLLQHEWSKHGTCMAGETPASYFRRSNRLYAQLRYPNMNALSRKPLTAGDFAVAFAKANSGLSADMVRVTANRQGWLEELWLCLDRSFAYTRCAAHSGGLAPNAPLKIWRGMR